MLNDLLFTFYVYNILIILYYAQGIQSLIFASMAWNKSVITPEALSLGPSFFEVFGSYYLTSPYPGLSNNLMSTDTQSN